MQQRSRTWFFGAGALWLVAHTRRSRICHSPAPLGGCRLRKVQGVLRPPLARLRADLALAVRLAGAFDPDVCVDERVRRLNRRGFAERAARRVAPALVRVALGVRAVAVAAGVDDERLVAHHGGELLAVR